jgi:hypothetical protein
MGTVGTVLGTHFDTPALGRHESIPHTQSQSAVANRDLYSKQVLTNKASALSSALQKLITMATVGTVLDTHFKRIQEVNLFEVHCVLTPSKYQRVHDETCTTCECLLWSSDNDFYCCATQNGSNYIVTMATAPRSEIALLRSLNHQGGHKQVNLLTPRATTI